MDTFLGTLMQTFLQKLLQMILEFFGISDAVEGAQRTVCQSLYKTGINLWNAMTSQAFTFAGISPSAADNASYELVTRLQSAFQIIAIQILIIAFLYRYFKTFNESREAVDLYTIIKVMVMMFLAQFAVMNSAALFDQIFGIGSGLCSLIGVSAAGLSPNDEIMSLLSGDIPGTGLLTLLVLFIFCACLVVTGAGILITVVQRLLKLFTMLPFAGMALATLIGGGRVSEIGYSYIRSFLGYIMEGIMIMLILIIGNNIVSSNILGNAFEGIAFDENSWFIWRLLVLCIGQIIGCGAISGMVRQADSLVHRMFGL